MCSIRQRSKSRRGSADQSGADSQTEEYNPDFLRFTGHNRVRVKKPPNKVRLHHQHVRSTVIIIVEPEWVRNTMVAACIAKIGQVTLENGQRKKIG